MTTFLVGKPPLVARQLAALLSILIFLGLAADSAQAEVSYLRPDSEITQSTPWSVVGAAQPWQALDDPITEGVTPSMADYIWTESGSTASIGFQTAPLAGTTNQVAEAFLYSTTANPINLEVRPNGTKVTITKAGWSSIKLPTFSTQEKLDTAAFKITSSSGGLRQIPAVFIKLSYTYQPKVYWGARIDGEVYGSPHDAPWDPLIWKTFEDSTLKPVSIVHFGQLPPWKANFTPTPLELTSAGGAIPLMSMGSEGATLYEMEEGGAKEPDLRKWAKAVATEYKKPFFFRWDWEMNLISASNIPWAAQARADPAAFVRAWRNFRRIADQEGATNITWVWCPNVSYPGSTSLQALYPGNAYVDWTCMDGYNHGTTGGWTSWVPFYNVFANTYGELTDDKSFEGWQKPIMIGETASTEGGGSKPSWVTQALATDLPWKFPRIKALVWFNWNITEESNGINTQWDWPIESKPATTAAFASGIASPYYASDSYQYLPELTRVQPLP